MGVASKYVLVGAATVSVADWVTAGGAGSSFVDLGHTKAPSTLTGTIEVFDVKSERVFGIIKSKPIDGKITLKVPTIEVSAENLRIAFGQPAANKSGTGDNLTLRVGDFPEQYHQVTLVTSGPGTTGVRTFTFWRARITGMGELPFGKGAEQVLELTLEILYDDSVATADKFFKMVDA